MGYEELTPNDVLFKADDNGWYDSIFNHKHDDLTGYLMGYRRAGEILSEYVIQNRRGMDYLIFPIVFNYRHFIELVLKDIIKYGYALFDIKQGVPKKHNIDELWKEVRDLAKKAWPDGDEEDLLLVDNCLKEFNKVDPGSDAFRYSVDKKGNKNLGNFTRISIRNFSNVVNKLCNSLEGINWGIYEYYTQKCEIDSHYE